MTDPRPAEGPDREACGKDAGSRPFWMSPDQYDPCPCVRPKGHDGDHGCRDHDKPADDVALLPSPPAPGDGDTDLRAEAIRILNVWDRESVEPAEDCLDALLAGPLALAARPDADRDALARARVLLDDLAADNTMILAPGWMVRDAIVAKVRAALSRDAEGEA